MRFTDEPASPRTNPCQTVQVFSAKVTGLEVGLQWPLDVFGFVAIRDSIDHRRNIIFDRTRNNCQTLTKKVALPETCYIPCARRFAETHNTTLGKEPLYCVLGAQHSANQRHTP
jgi:hypothetical protein